MLQLATLAAELGVDLGGRGPTHQIHLSCLLEVMRRHLGDRGGLMGGVVVCEGWQLGRTCNEVVRGMLVPCCRHGR